MEKKLNKKEEFVDKTWVLYASGNIITYRFKRNGVLRKSIDGNYSDLHWELEGLDAIAISGEDKRSGEIFNHGFVLNGLLIVQKEGSDLLPVIFYNSDVVRDGDVVKYIRNVIIEKEMLEPLENRGEYFVSKYQTREIGDVVYDADICPVVEDVIWTYNYRLSVKNGRIIKKEYVIKINVDNDDLFVVSTREIYSNDNIKEGDWVYKNKKPLFANAVYKVNNSRVTQITVWEGKVLSVKRKGYHYELILFVLFIVIMTIVLMLIK